MLRHWHTPLPPLPATHAGISWVDWVMPWVIFIGVSALLVWLGSLLPPSHDVNTRPDTPPVPVTLGHPSLDRAWSHAKKHPLLDEPDDPFPN